VPYRLHLNSAVGLPGRIWDGAIGSNRVNQLAEPDPSLGVGKRRFTLVAAGAGSSRTDEYTAAPLLRWPPCGKIHRYTDSPRLLSDEPGRSVRVPSQEVECCRVQ